MTSNQRKILIETYKEFIEHYVDRNFIITENMKIEYLSDSSIENIVNTDQTAWQWLSRYRRYPKNGEKAFSRKYEMFNSTWYYYTLSQTQKVTEEEYENLKKEYIKKYGAWENIDLETTEYDGHKWMCLPDKY